MRGEEVLMLFCLIWGTMGVIFHLLDFDIGIIMMLVIVPFTPLIGIKIRKKFG